MSVTGRITRKVVAETVRPYVDQALHDDELHARAQKAYASGQSIYEKLRKEPDFRAAASRLASDRKLQRELRATLAEVQGAARRIGRRPPRRRLQTLRTVALAAGIGAVVLTVARRTSRPEPA